MKASWLWFVNLLWDKLREEQRLRLFENRVLRIIFGSKGDEVRGD
jgi:hypothetical protein